MAALQIDFALALSEKGEWPAQVMPSVARYYLNSPPKTFAYEQRIPAATLRHFATELLLSEAVPLLQWPRIESLLAGADAQFKRLVLVNYCGQDFRSRAFELAQGCNLSEPLLADLQRRDLSFTGAIASALVLTRTLGPSWGADVPDTVRQALLWDLRSGNDTEAQVSLSAYSNLDPSVASGLLRECLREERAIALIPALKDESVIQALIARIEESGESSEVAADALVACGARAASALVAACTRKPLATSVGVIAAEVLGRLSPAELGTLIGLLGHSSKRVVSAAAWSLELQGEPARAELTAGTRSTKKTIRLHSARLLAKLEQQQFQTSTPLDRVTVRLMALSVEARNAFVDTWNSANDSEAEWQTRLRPEVRRLGAVALELVRPWFLAKLEDGETRLWCYAVEELRDDPEAVWVAVDTFARMPQLAASLWARPRRALAHCGPLLSAPIVHALRSVHTEYREALFGLLAAHADRVDPSVFLAGLSDPSKVVRTHSVDGLSRSGDAPWEEVAALLRATEIGTRVAAAELLAVWGRPETVDKVAAAWSAEVSRQVRPYLEDALVACGRTDLVFSLNSTTGDCELGAGAVERYLVGQQLARKLPGFLRLEDLPRLRFRSGSDAPLDVRRGFLARLMKLDLTLKGRAVRAMLPLLSAEDVRVWSRWIYEGWSKMRSSKQKWAVLQLSLLANDELLDEAMSKLGEWQGREHTAVNCHLRAAQWHGSEASMKWLGYWSENLASLGGRSTARALFGRVAFKRRCSVSKLRAHVEPFLAEEREESRLTSELPAGFPRQGLRARLERSWLSGREWPSATLLTLLSTQPSLGGEFLLWRASQGQACRLIRDAEGRFQWVDLEGRAAALTDTFRLAHPLDLRPSEVEEWRAVALGKSPFPQLERRCYTSSQLTELASVTAPTERFARWRRAGRWFHGEPMDGGVVYTDSQHLLGRNLIITLQHSGYGIGAAEFDDEVHIWGVDFTDLDGKKLTPSELPAIVYSELHRDILELAFGTAHPV
jgi:hypothetical protein